MTMSASTIRLDAELRKELTRKLDEIGLTLNGYFTLAAKQFLIQGKVPFEIKTEPPVKEVKFTPETKQVLLRAYAEELGLLPNTGQTFDNVDDAMKELFR